MDELSIGAMANISGVSVRTLRLYHEIGLLSPAIVDENTGYRRYSFLQVGRLSCIDELKNAGMTLREISDVINNGDAMSLRASMIEKRDGLIAEMEQTRIKLAMVNSTISSCDSLIHKPECDKVLHQLFDTRYGIVLATPEELDASEGGSYFDKITRRFLSWKTTRIGLCLFRPLGFATSLSSRLIYGALLSNYGRPSPSRSLTILGCGRKAKA